MTVIFRISWKEFKGKGSPFGGKNRISALCAAISVYRIRKQLNEKTTGRKIRRALEKSLPFLTGIWLPGFCTGTGPAAIHFPPPFPPSEDGTCCGLSGYHEPPDGLVCSGPAQEPVSPISCNHVLFRRSAPTGERLGKPQRKPHQVVASATRNVFPVMHSNT